MFDFLSQKISSVFSKITGQDKLSEKNISDALIKINDVLLEADVPYDVVETFIAEVKEEVIGQKVINSLKPSEHLTKVVYDKVLEFLGGKSSQSSFNFAIPSVVMVMGLQGSGKTTTIAKLANFVSQSAKKRGKKRKIMIGSVDFYRPAAIDQLEILANQTDAIFYRSNEKDPVLAAQDIARNAKNHSCDILFLDTAGRLHVDDEMLNELKLIDAKVNPKYKLLVIDSMTGQESLKVAKTFEDKIGFIGSVLTKMDSDTRGGLAFAFKYSLNKPILYVAVGEKIEDLEHFKPERMASRIVGMGDMMTLVEKAQEKIKANEQKAMYKSLSQGKLTLQDFANQIDMVNRLGSLTSLIKYLPGMGSMNLSQDLLDKGEGEIKKFKAIIGSMTLKERVYPKVLDSSRKNRIAKGSGVKTSDVDLLLSRFEQSKQLIKVFKKMGKI